MMPRNRRIGDRYEVDAQSVVWEPTGRRRKRRRPPEIARLVELSVSGAAFVAAPGVAVGENVRISVTGATGALSVRVR